MKKVIVAANWKMNKTVDECVDFMKNLLGSNIFCGDNDTVLPIVCPPSLYLQKSIELTTNCSIFIGAQDVSTELSGAYTGEISAAMLRSIGIKYCIVGHSERREYHQETDEEIRVKAINLLNENITPIICVGEKLEHRESDRTKEIILSQIDTIFTNLPLPADIIPIIAYEPVWAIGTGKTATPEMAQEVHSLIKSRLSKLLPNTNPDLFQIIYGGSVKTDNFASLLIEQDISGGLVGGVSLDPESYLKLIDTAKKLQTRI